MGFEGKSVTVDYKNISKKFRDVVAVDHLNLEVKSGEYLILLGPSGCGKTTILRMLAGLENPTEGDIFINDVNVNTLHPKDRDIAMVFQNYALYPHMTVYQNLYFPLEARKISKGEIRKKVFNVAKILGISDLLDRKPKELSGGEAQRVALGRAIIREPRVFLMDEPLANLDAKLRIEMRDELLRLHRKLKTTIIYVTHDQEEAMSMGDRLVVFKNGVLQQVASPHEIYNKPKNRFVAEFIGNPKMNIYDGIINPSGFFILNSDKQQKYRLPNGKFSILTNDKGQYPILVGIRPEDIQISKKPLQNSIKAKIDLVEVTGRELRVCVMIGSDIYTVLSPITLNLKFGEEIYLIPNNDRIHIFNRETEQRIE